jgi:protein-S-isoprenylcysteine O-methyltransferase Ste14
MPGEGGLVKHFMKALELKIPPPIVALLVGVAMWKIAKVCPLLDIPLFIREVTAGVLLLAGAAIAFPGFVALIRARTTFNSMKPKDTSSLVTGGIYRFTRNPMYVSLLFILVAWAIFLSSAWALVAPVVFVLYINRFQIKPEERVLTAMFGTTYTEYKGRVRRWL